MVPLQPLCLRHEIGEVIKDRYTVREVLGAGAFGTVYRVEETRGAHTVVKACKEMHVLDDPATAVSERGDALRMFQEEAFLLETLRNTHIPAAYFESAKSVWLACPVCGRTFKGVRQCPDHGAALQVVEERFYLIMDFIEGPDLEQHLAANSGRPLEETPVLDWALQVCDALEAVHAKGLSHRDIKPANIKIQSGSGQAMLIDFGLVKPSEVAGGYGTMVMRKSTGLGTLGYAPPSPQEQAHPDARTDILALGMTLYRLLTRHDPTDPGDLDAMRRATPRSFNPALSVAMDAIIKRSTQIEPAARYPNVAQLRADLQAARYPVETTCAGCGYVQRSAQPPDGSTRCQRCGRLIMPPTRQAALAGAALRQTAPPLPGTTSGTTSGAPGLARPNPYAPRIAQLRAQLANPPGQLATKHDARIRELDAMLTTVSRLAVGLAAERCPGCQNATLAHITGQPTGQCPLCRRAQLKRRQLEFDRCPICQNDKLEAQALPEDRAFCPVCRLFPLQEERRTHFGMVVDLWWRCPNCNAGLDVLRSGKATLAEVGEDPLGVSQQYRGQTLSLEEWRRVSERSRRYRICEACAAQFDEMDDDHFKLVYCPFDPHRVGARTLGQTLPGAAWARLARDTSDPGDSTTGTHFCPECAAEFDYDRARHSMMLLQPGKKPPDWALRWRGIAVPIQNWYLTASGKRSRHPGLLCPQCGTEFDQDAAPLFKLVETPMPALRPYLNESLTLEDWQRRARNVPTMAEARTLRAELTRLQDLQLAEQTQAQHDLTRQRDDWEREIKQLYKQAVLEGCYPLQRISPQAMDDVKRTPGGVVAFPLNALHLPLRYTETLRWETAATECRVTTTQHRLLWEREEPGMLIITTERVLFVYKGDAGSNHVWQRALTQLSGIEVQNVQGAQVVAMQFDNLQHPVGFEMAIGRWTLYEDGVAYDIIVSPQDLEALVRALALG